MGARRATVAMLVSALLHSAPLPARAAELTPTAQTGIGVWYAPGAPAIRDLWRPGDAGERLILRIRVLGTRRIAVAGAVVELWHADSFGAVHADRYRTRLSTDTDGKLEVSTVLPGYIWGPRHVHVVVTHPQHADLITRIFFKRDPLVGESEFPELAVFLEDGIARGEPVLFADVELVLAGR